MPLGLAVQFPKTIRETQVPSPEERVFLLVFYKNLDFPN